MHIDLSPGFHQTSFTSELTCQWNSSPLLWASFPFIFYFTLVYFLYSTQLQELIFHKIQITTVHISGETSVIWDADWIWALFILFLSLKLVWVLYWTGSHRTAWIFLWLPRYEVELWVSWAIAKMTEYVKRSFTYFLFSFTFIATPVAYGRSQARGWIGAAAEAYAIATATQDLSRIGVLHHSSWQCWVLNPLNKAGVEHASSWILVEFVSSEPQGEFLFHAFWIPANHWNS